MLDYAQLETLAAVIRCGSFEIAAAQLNVTQSAVSQRIRHLEERVGSPLVRRGHPCTGTEIGLRLARHVEDVALLETQLNDTLPRPSGRIRIAVNADSLATWLIPALAQVDNTLFDLVVDDQDHSAEWLKRGHVSAAITAVAHPPQGCDSQALGAMRYHATASPDYVKRHFPQGVTRAALQQAPMMVFNSKDGLQHAWMKENFQLIHSGPSHTIPSTNAFVEGARTGLGWGMNPEMLIADDLASGALVALEPNCPFDTPLYWQSSRLLGAVLAPLTRCIRDAARQHLRATD
ncbi:MAG: LysR family transcriptional regulator ArgP [Thalassovita sp.]